VKPGLLVNENFPAPSTHALRAAGVDVIAVIDRHRGISDREVMALAREQGRWLLTFDTDYAELVFHQRLPPPPAVVLLREKHYRPGEPAQWILSLLESRSEIAGFFCVVTRSGLRKRPLMTSVPGNAY